MKMFRRRKGVKPEKTVEEEEPEEEATKLAQLLSLGYKENDIKVALLRNNNNYDMALDTLRQEKRHISSGKLKSQAIDQMVSMGIDETEAYYAAEASNGNLSAAIEKLSNKKRQSTGVFESKRSIFSAESPKKRESTVREVEVDPFAKRLSTVEEPLDKLLALGYNRSEVVEALRQNLGDMDKAIESLQESYIAEFERLGFERRTVKAAVKVASGNVGLAIDILKLNLTKEGAHHYTDPALLDYLRSKGYSRTDSGEALKAAGGHLKIALFYLKFPEILFPDSSTEL